MDTHLRTHCVWLLFALDTVYSLNGLHNFFDPVNYCRQRNHPTTPLPHPYDCSKYIVCANGLGYLQTCGRGMDYDEQRGICDYRYNVPCFEKLHRREQNTLDPLSLFNGFNNQKQIEKEQTPDEKSSKLEPQNDKTVLQTIHVVHQLPNLDDIYKRIRPPLDEYEISSTYVDSEHCIHDGLFPHHDECTQYYQCMLGLKYRRTCPVGTYFDPTFKVCGFDNGRCHARKSSTKTTAHKYSPRVKAKSLDNLPTEIQRLITDIEAELSGFITEAEHMTELIHNQEASFAQDMQYSHKRPFAGVQSFLGSTPYVKQLSIPAFMQLHSLQMIQSKYRLSPKNLRNVMETMPSFLAPNEDKVFPDMEPPEPSMGICPYPKNTRDNACDPYAKYRTYDGSCNNLDRPLWGKSMRTFARFLPADYSDGIQQPRKSVRGRELPGARHLSFHLFKEKDQKSHVHNMMLMTYGQFHDHDLGRSAVTKLSKEKDGKGNVVDVMCGESECETDGPENRACMPIPLAEGYDPDFYNTNKTCLMFVRTQEVMNDDCELGPREQLNQLTSHIDASNIYGSTKEQAEKLRDMKDKSAGSLT